MEERLRQEVERFLSRHVYCVLATCGDAQPLATVVMYASKGLEIYFFTGAGTKKLRNMQANPRVSVAVPGRRYLFFPQAVEIIGRAEQLAENEAERAKAIYFSRRRPEFQGARRIARREDVTWVKISPERVYTYGLSTKPWELEPEKQFKRVL